MSTSPAKFTFDLDLRHSERKDRLVSETALTALLQQAREESYAQGFAEGERGVTATAAQALAAAAELLAARSAEMTVALDDARKLMLRDGIELAASVGRKLAGHLLARQPTVEIETLVAECMAVLEGVPHLVIRCHGDLADAVRDIATTHMTTSGFTGRLVVMGDPDQRLGDCRIEWVDGGLARDVVAIGNEIDRRIAAYLAAHGATRDPEEN
jgi:flagellar assembly protein FliH